MASHPLCLGDTSGNGLPITSRPDKYNPQPSRHGTHHEKPCQSHDHPRRFVDLGHLRAGRIDHLTYTAPITSWYDATGHNWQLYAGLDSPLQFEFTTAAPLINVNCGPNQ